MLYASELLLPLIKLADRKTSADILLCGNRSISAADLLKTSGQLAVQLASMGFKKDDPVVLLLRPGIEFLQAFYAVMMLRGKPAIIDPEMGRDNFMAKLRQFDPSWAFIDSRLLFLREHPLLKHILMRYNESIPPLSFQKKTKIIASGMRMPLFKKYPRLADLIARAESPAGISPEPESECGEFLVTYTSGTLSAPKAVVHTHASLSASNHLLTGLLASHKQELIGATLPHFMLLGISAGIPVKLMDNSLPAQKKLRWLRREDISVLFGPPSDFMGMILYCEKNKTRLPDCLNHVLIGSAPVHKSFLKRLLNVLPAHTKVTCTYGMTENLLVATIDGRDKVKYDKEGDIVGKPVAGVQVQTGSDGELLVKSPQLFSRYFHEASRPEWHGTGDLGYMDENGAIILAGRKKDMIIRRNTNIYPALYEDTIKSIPGVEEAAMVGIYDPDLEDECVYLAIESSSLSEAAIRKYLKKGVYSIDKEATPDQIVFMSIPRKGRQQKIDRAAIINHIKSAYL